jgi:hypothetical protein
MSILSFLVGLITLATSTTAIIDEPPHRSPEMTPETIKQLIVEKSIEAGLSEAKIEQIIATIECESQFQNVQSNCLYKNGERELSFGISQIHLPAHPNITKEQALDIEFAVDFIVLEFKKGNEKKWSCWKKLFL